MTRQKQVAKPTPEPEIIPVSYSQEDEEKDEETKSLVKNTVRSFSDVLDSVTKKREKEDDERKTLFEQERNRRIKEFGRESVGTWFGSARYWTAKSFRSG